MADGHHKHHNYRSGMKFPSWCQSFGVRWSSESSSVRWTKESEVFKRSSQHLSSACSFPTGWKIPNISSPSARNIPEQARICGCCLSLPLRFVSGCFISVKTRSLKVFLVFELGVSWADWGRTAAASLSGQTWEIQLVCVGPQCASTSFLRFIISCELFVSR